MAAQGQGMHSLSTIIKRLEAVTSRLEDVATSQSSTAPTASIRSPTSDAHETLTGPAVPSIAAEKAPEQESTPAVTAYQTEIINGPLNDLLAKSKAVGGVVEQQTALLGPLCSAQLAFLQLASKHAKPSASGLPPLLGPQGEAIQAITEAKDKLGRGKEGRDWAACLSVIAEGVSAWGWVQVEPAPAPFIAEMRNAAQFWADRATKQFKDSNPAVITWHKAYSSLIEALQKYVKQWHTTGVTWNPKGPPAPTSMPPTNPPSASSSPSAPAGPTAMLAELSRGTSGLKKVDPSQMTHKNPDLRTSSTVPETKRSITEVKPKTAVSRKPARTELEDGNKWIIENHDGNKSIIIDQTELSHTIHIFSCQNSVIQIKGKVNAVSMVGCKKTALVIESAVSSLSITSSPSFEVQITGVVPTVQIDTTDSGAVYLSQECMETVEIITSKTSSINISVPGADGDFEERPVPEQMKSKLVKGKLITEIVEHAG